MTVNGNSTFGSSTPFTMTNTGSSGSPVRGTSAAEADAQNPFVAEQSTIGGDSVSLSAAQQGLIMADDNRDGVVDKQELANAAYQLLNNPNASETDLQVGRLFASMVLGGKEGQALLPDMNGDGGISANELALLASGDQQDMSISTQDFSFAFSGAYNINGSDFTLSDLEAIANGQQPANPPAAGSTAEDSSGGTAAPGAGTTQDPVNEAGTATETPPESSAAQGTGETGQSDPAANGSDGVTDGTTGDTPAASQDPKSTEATINNIVSAFTELLQAMLNPSQDGQSGKNMLNAFVKFFTALTEAFGKPQDQQDQTA
ncbi:hypothetical protein [Vampirovibrio chlorellavorus]|uniref:hypothetical protein n=1 Tax=Vampirovibrio chlorellavorus TaxID=758823 RepID=UPI0026F3466A|nr:hypothetical protein [Vampirovibrio chlorellavorus]